MFQLTVRALAIVAVANAANHAPVQKSAKAKSHHHSFKSQVYKMHTMEPKHHRSTMMRKLHLTTLSEIDHNGAADDYEEYERGDSAAYKAMVEACEACEAAEDTAVDAASAASDAHTDAQNKATEQSDAEDDLKDHQGDRTTAARAFDLDIDAIVDKLEQFKIAVAAINADVSQVTDETTVETVETINTDTMELDTKFATPVANMLAALTVSTSPLAEYREADEAVGLAEQDVLDKQKNYDDAAAAADTADGVADDAASSRDSDCLATKKYF